MTGDLLKGAQLILGDLEFLMPIPIEVFLCENLFRSKTGDFDLILHSVRGDFLSVDLFY